MISTRQERLIARDFHASVLVQIVISDTTFSSRLFFSFMSIERLRGAL